jgi:hypothetical protein
LSSGDSEISLLISEEGQDGKCVFWSTRAKRREDGC